MSLHENEKTKQGRPERIFSPILAFTFFLTFILFGIINILSFWGVNANLKKSITEELESHNRIVSNAVSQFFIGKLHTVLLLDQYHPIQDLLRQCRNYKEVPENLNYLTVISMLDSVNTMYEEMDRIYNHDKYVGSEEVMWLASVPGDFLLTPSILMHPDFVGDDGKPDPWVTKDRPWYPYISKTRDIAFTDTYIDAQFLVPCVSIVKTVRETSAEGSDELIGIIGFDVFLPTVNAIMREAQGNKSGMSLLVDGNDIVIYHPDLEFSLDNQLQNLGQGYDVIAQKIRDKTASSQNVSRSFITEIKGVSSFVAYNRIAIPNVDWFVISIVPQSEAERAVSDYFYSFIVLGVVDLLLFLFPIGLFFYLEQRKQKSVLETNQKLAAAQKEAEQASRSKSEFLATMSHEIRTPLNGVIGLSNLLLGTELKAKQNEYVRLIYESGKSLLFLINDILDFSKIEAGKLELERTEFSLQTTLVSVFGILAAKAGEKHLELCSVIDPDVPAVVLGDEGRLRQILLNLVGNALKFTDAGGITVELKAENFMESGTHFHFRVTDSGIGIPADRLDRLFHSFSQVDTSSSRKYGGTGLGLAISKTLVQLMGGTIGVESRPGQGSTFWFSLPLQLAGQESETTILNFDNNQIRTRQISDLTGHRILVVDDNFVQRHALARQMSSWGMVTEECSCLSGAVDLLLQAIDQNRPYELAVIDNTLDMTNGYELVDAILADKRLSQTALVLLAPLDATEKDLAMPENRQAAVSSRHLQMLGKPVFCSTLFDAVIAVLFPESPLKVSSLWSPEDKSGVHVISLHKMRRPRILVAEDNRVNQLVVQEILTQFEIDCDIVDNGIKACEAVESRNYDLVLMDCQMPEMDGYEATLRIRNREKNLNITPGIPIIALTANATQEDEQLSLNAGMNAYCVKPINPKLLFKTLQLWLNEK